MKFSLACVTKPKEMEIRIHILVTSSDENENVSTEGKRRFSFLSNEVLI
jgi:hypothetical protein